MSGRSSYATKLQSETKAEASFRARLSLARQRRTDEARRALDEETLGVIGIYQREKARAASKGRPVLPTIRRVPNRRAAGGDADDMSTSIHELADYDALVERLMATGVGQQAAERYARGRFPNAAVERATQDEVRENVLEKEEQREVVKLFKAFGFDVYSLSQARASKQTPGIPDLWLMHREYAIGFWWETKRADGGRFSEAQVRFRATCERCGIGYGCGDRRDARNHLIRLGLAMRVGDTLEQKRV